MDRAYSCWMLNLFVRHVTSRLWKVKRRHLRSCGSTVWCASFSHFITGYLLFSSYRFFRLLLSTTCNTSCSDMLNAVPSLIINSFILTCQIFWMFLSLTMETVRRVSLYMPVLKLTNYMGQSPSWKASNFMTACTRALDLSLSWASSIQPTPSTDFCQIYFNIILPCMVKSPKWSVVKLPTKMTGCARIKHAFCMNVKYGLVQ